MTTEAIRNAGEAGADPRVRQELWAIVAGVAAVLLFFALVSFRPEAASANWIGPVGSFLADTLLFSLGAGAYGVVALTGWTAWSIARRRPIMERTGEVIGWVLAFVSIIVLLSLLFAEVAVSSHPVGGLLGRALADLFASMLGSVGAGVLAVGGGLSAVILISGQTLGGLWGLALERFATADGEEDVAPAVKRSMPVVDEEVSSVEEGGAPSRFSLSKLRMPRVSLAALFRRRSAWTDDADGEEGATGDTSAEDGAGAAPDGSDGGEGRAPASRGEESGSAARRPGLDEDPAWVESFESFASDGAGHAGAEASDATHAEADARAVASHDASFADSATEAIDMQAEDGSGALAAPRIHVSPRTVTSAKGSGAQKVAADAGSGAKSDRPSAVTVGSGESGSPVASAKKSSVAAEREGSLADRLRKVRYDDAQEGASSQGASDSGASGAGGAEEVSGSWHADSEELPLAEEFSGPCAAAGPAAGARDRRDDAAIGPAIVENPALRERARREDLERADVVREREPEPECAPWQFPPMRFLAYEESDPEEIDHDHLKAQAAQLEQVLSEFRVEGKVTGIRPGPVVTMFEFEPAAGIKVSKISGLSKDIAMALRAEKIRIIAPLPGRGCVGVEIPNEKREIVYLKEILAHESFRQARSKLTISLGKDIAGVPVVANLQKMPHLLVAGTTGSGKSVAVNAFITSILYNASPDDVRMILIDPKQLELAVYEGVPHLLLPVVTEPGKAATALNWAVMEMERRYTLMKEMKVRNLEGYNARLKDQLERHGRDGGSADAQPREAAMLTEQEPDGRWRHRHMPYLLIVIDEFADLIMTAGKEVEISVARLAQKARAAGIHVILATQRPSVDVLTGLIKANFPTRISFRLIAPQDSRTVLDTQGAESLLGQGDMLFRPPGRSDLQRVHGAWVDEREIEQVVEFLKAQREADYDESILHVPEEGGGDFEDEEVDELYDDAIAAVVKEGYASISMVQRRLRIGYNRAARIMEQMEREGVIGPATGGSSRREVLVQHHE